MLQTISHKLSLPFLFLHKQSSSKATPSSLSSMADTDTDTSTKQHQLVKEQKLQNKPNPRKYNTNFLYKKAVIIIIFLIIIPVFPSQAPEFINQTLLNRTWELLHLLFVGIAVSYGLFSQRNDQTEKEINNNNQSKFDNVQSYVSKFLQVSSVSDDEAENIFVSDHETKVQHQQTWSSQYYRNEPPVFVAKKQGQDNNNNKPLLLPVRSLRSRVLEPNKVDETNSSTLRRSNSGLRSSKRKNGESLLEKKMDENNNIVLPSPIPWRSRSGRMEVKEASSSSLSNEIQAKSAEDIVRKKTIYRSPPPPPPPPPPPTFVGKSSPMKPTFTKTLRFKSEPTFIEFPREEKQKFVENLVMETTTTDDDDDSESDEEVGTESSFGSSTEKASSSPSPSNGIDGGSDVDKKADEFIAKVREQIRLQRIDSIKRSSGQIKRNSTR